MNFSPPAFAIEQLQTLINHALEFDPGTRLALGDLAGKTLAIEVNFPAISIAVYIEDGGCVALTNPAGDHFDAKLTGSPLALARLMSRSEETYSFANSGVALDGEQELLRQLGDILGNLDIDWEHAMAGIAGDTPAHLAGQAVRSANDLFKNFANRSQSGVGDYVREESGFTASNAEAMSWFEGVRLLAADSDRVATRVKRLEALVDNTEQATQSD